jgi:L-threonylcarbamoyladenylate synthase
MVMDRVKSDGLERACAIIARGGVIIFPTDTVYGIGCAPSSSAGIERIYAAKGRPRDKPLTLHFATVEQMLEYAPNDARALVIALAFLPGPLTLVVRRPPFIDAALVGGLATLGLRVPNHELCAALLARCGPLAATSANLSGAPAYSGRETSVSRGGARGELPEADFFIDAGPAPLGVASTVVDLSGADVRLIRAGSVPFEAVNRIL